MRCDWNSLINLLPQWMRNDVDKHGKDSLQELRLRIDSSPELLTAQKAIYLKRAVSIEDLQFCVNTASRYSPWSARTNRFGYITAPGGHRIGMCGQGLMTDKEMTGIGSVTSLCIRVARDFCGIAEGIAGTSGSILIIGKPGSGKTTLLRDLIRIRSEKGNKSVAVVDEKMEIFPVSNGRLCFPPGPRTDILTGCNKQQGIVSLLRNMGPGTIAVDEITAQEDCQSLLEAGWCGVDLIATAHAASRRDLMSRRVYRPILESRLFDTLLVLREDKSWYRERMDHEY